MHRSKLGFLTNKTKAQDRMGDHHFANQRVGTGIGRGRGGGGGGWLSFFLGGRLAAAGLR
jgi:hypothetical protein